MAGTNDDVDTSHPTLSHLVEECWKALVIDEESTNYTNLVTLSGTILDKLTPSTVSSTVTRHRSKTTTIEDDDKNFQDTNVGDDDLGALRVAMEEIHVKALLHTDEIGKASQFMAQAGRATAFPDVWAYCKYRQGDALVEEKVSDSTPAVVTPPMQTDTSCTIQKHIQAQAAYRNHDTNGAFSHYVELLQLVTDDDEKERNDVYTNLAAVLLAQAIPYSGDTETVKWQNVLQQRVVTLVKMKPQDEDEDWPYDLVYNVATLSLLSKNDGGRSQSNLVKAEQHADNEIDSIPILFNQDWSRVYWTAAYPLPALESMSTANSTKTQTESVQVLMQVYRALQTSNPREGLKLYPGEPFAKWTPLQQYLWWYNKGVLELRAEQYDDCMRTCQGLIQAVQPPSTTTTGKKTATAKKQQQQQQPVSSLLSISCPLSSAAARVWWETRAIVLQRHCATRMGQAHDEAAASELETRLEKLPQSYHRDHAYLYYRLHRLYESNGIDKHSIQSFLENDIPESLRAKPAILATLASLYQQESVGAIDSNHGTTKLREWLNKSQSTATIDRTVEANLAMSRQDYTRAAQLLEAETTDPVAIAQWVQALSYVDPVRAREVWSRMRQTKSSDLCEVPDCANLGVALETRPLPHLSSRIKSDIITAESNKSSKFTTVQSSTYSVVEQQKQQSAKNRERILRRRARQREAYLQRKFPGNIENNRLPEPDPERWLPRYERSYHTSRARRRKPTGTYHKGAQGGVSEADAAMLDVRQRREIIPEGPTTVHMNVSGNGGFAAGVGRKGGRRR